jgi:hypothetical protein
MSSPLVIDRVTVKIFLFIIIGYSLLWLPAAFWPGYLDTPFGLIAAIPLLAIYPLHAMGMPGLLQHDGLCGWGWCAPTMFGWVFLLVFWLVVVWLLAKGISALNKRARRLD